MDNKYFKKNFNMIGDWLDALGMQSYMTSYDEYDGTSFLQEPSKKDDKPKNTVVTTQDFFRYLSDLSVKTISVEGENLVKLTYTDKPDLKFEVMNSDDNNIPSLAVHYTKNQSWAYLNTRYNSNNVFIINLKNFKYSDFEKNKSLSVGSAECEVVITYKQHQFILNNNPQNSKILNYIFDLIPEFKTEYLACIKKKRSWLEKEIHRIENTNLYKITDEDRLIMEVMDDE